MIRTIGGRLASFQNPTKCYTDSRNYPIQAAAADLQLLGILDFPHFCRHFSASSVKLLECQRAQKVEMTVPAGSIVKPFYVIEHI